MVRRMLTSLAAVAIAVAAPAVPSDAVPSDAVPSGEAPPNSPSDAAAADRLTIVSDYQDHAVTETVDLRTGAREVLVERGHEHHREAVHTGDDGEPADTRDDGVVAQAVSTSARCSNGTTFNYVDWSSSGRQPRPWRISEPMAVNPSGAPSLGFDWKSTLVSASNIWRFGTNPCGLPDQVGWLTPSRAPDTSAVPGNLDGVNAHGWQNFGGWSNGSILLGRTYLWSNGTSGMREADIHYNNHPDAKWCDGRCTGGWDLRSVAAHEWGHYLGLGHVCNDADLDNPCDTDAEHGAVMLPWINQNDTQNRMLSLGDINGAASLYPHEWGFEVTDVRIVNPAGSGEALTPGRTYAATVRARNTGSRHWPVGGGIDLRTADGLDSEYADGSWVSSMSASPVDTDLTRWSHPDIPGNDHDTVVMGEEAEFSFTVTVPFSNEPTTGTFDDVEAMTMGGATFTSTETADVPLPVGSIAVEVAGQSGPTFLGQSGVVMRGQQSDAAVSVRNAGTAPWFLDDGLIRLVTDPGGTCSPFEGDDWHSCEVASLPDTLANVVLPGQTVPFQFRMSVPTLAPVVGPQSQDFVMEWLTRPDSRVEPVAPFSFVVL